VPTWNYAAVQIYGTITVYPSTASSETGAFLSQQVSDLTKLCEVGQMGYKPEESWEVSDAPERYTELLKKAIMGVEIEVKRIGGKFKMSQELEEGDRMGVVRGFGEQGTEKDRLVAALVEERGALKP